MSISTPTSIMLMFAFTLRPLVAHLDFHTKHNPAKYVSPKTVVTLKNGKVQGYTSEINHRSIHVYKGIPYSEPPEEEYRFEKPTPKEEWDGYWDATEYGPKCPQWDFRRNSFNNGAEDCLSYNVFAHSECLTNSCPVIVFISTDAQGKELTIINEYLQRPFVVVTFNFRTGILGYLNLGVSKADAPLNVGFYDITLALNTIHAEIAKFGGNADQITIISEQSNLAEYLMASTSTSNTFAKMITTTSSVPQLNSRRNSELSADLITQLGCQRPDVDSMLSCLRSMEVSELIAPEFEAMSAEADGNDLTFTSLEGMQKHWREVPLLYLLHIPPTVSSDISTQCQTYTPLFSFKLSPADCEKHYDTPSQLMEDLLSSYTSKVMNMNMKNGIFVSMNNIDKDMSVVFMDFASPNADIPAIQRTLMANGATKPELSSGSELWLPTEHPVSKRHLLQLVKHQQSRYRRFAPLDEERRVEEIALYVCCSLVVFIVMIVCFLAVVFYKRDAPLRVDLV